MLVCNFNYSSICILLSILRYMSTFSGKFNAECQPVKVRNGKNSHHKMFCVHRQDLPKTSSRNQHVSHKKYDPSKLSPGLKVAQANGLQVDPRKNMVKWGKKWVPTCDGSGFPYVKGCYHDMSNWTAPSSTGGPKQCYMYNPGSTNLSSGSLYTCGFLW